MKTPDIDIIKKHIDENYFFEAHINTAGGDITGSTTDVKSFIEESQKWQDKAREEEDQDIKTVAVSYELHPISTLKSFGNRKIYRSLMDEMMLARAKPIINDMAILISALKYLKEKAPADEQDELDRRIKDLEDKNTVLVDASNDNKITRDMIRDLRDYRLSRFLESDYYYQLYRKIHPEEFDTTLE